MLWRGLARLCVFMTTSHLSKLRPRGYKQCGIFTALSYVKARGILPGSWPKVFVYCSEAAYNAYYEHVSLLARPLPQPQPSVAFFALYQRVANSRTRGFLYIPP